MKYPSNNRHNLDRVSSHSKARFQSLGHNTNRDRTKSEPSSEVRTRVAMSKKQGQLTCRAVDSLRLDWGAMQIGDTRVRHSPALARNENGDQQTRRAAKHTNNRMPETADKSEAPRTRKTLRAF